MILHRNAKLWLLALTLIAAGCAATRTQRAPGEAIDDGIVTSSVKAALIANPDTKARHIDVGTFRGVVQLNGFVGSTVEKAAAETTAGKVNGVKAVRNNLQVNASTSTVGEVIDDTWITAKVKTALIADPIAKAHQIEVNTKDAVVQLGGFVDSAAEKTRAGEVTAAVEHVKSVENRLQVKQP